MVAEASSAALAGIVTKIFSPIWVSHQPHNTQSNAEITTVVTNLVTVIGLQLMNKLRTDAM